MALTHPTRWHRESVDKKIAGIGNNAFPRGMVHQLYVNKISYGVRNSLGNISAPLSRILRVGMKTGMPSYWGWCEYDRVSFTAICSNIANITW